MSKEMTLQQKLHTQRVLGQVLNERVRQDYKWGQQNRKPSQYSIILNEEVGEVNKEICEIEFSNDSQYEQERIIALREELIQVAAVAVAMIESLDRNELSLVEANKPLQRERIVLD